MIIISPCNKVCVLDAPSGWCIGCGRTGDEIAAWPFANDDERLRIMTQLPQRIAQLNATPCA
jgi:uncharacterized protein